MHRFCRFAPIFLIGLVACNQKQEAPAAPNAAAAMQKATAAAVEGFVVKTSALSNNITASGTLLSQEETELHPEASGRVVRINLPEGGRVRKGELLLKIFDEDLQTQLRKLEVQLKQAEITEQRLAELLKVKGVSQQEYDLAALAVQNLKNEMDLVRVNIGRTELRAPYDGVIGLRRISPGAYVTPASAIAVIRSDGGLKLDFSVPDRYGALLRTGQRLSFTTEGNTGSREATVLATEQRVDEGTRSLQVRALVKGNTAGLVPGAFAEVNLALSNNSQAIMVPNQSVIPQARDKKVIVARGGKAQFVTVKTGVRQPGFVEITDGLQPGDTIATTGMLFLRPDGPLKFTSVQ